MTPRYKDKELEVRTNIGSAFLIVFIATAIVLAIIYEEGNKLFDFKHFNPNGINTIIFILFLVVNIFWILKLIDRRVQLKIDAQGLWIRTSLLPFSKLQLINWSDIYFFYLQEKTQKGVTECYLILRTHETEIEKKIEISGLDTSANDILTIVRSYADKYSIQDLSEQHS